MTCEKAVVYQTLNEVLVISSSAWQKYQYEENIKATRIVVTDVTSEFWKYTKEITKQELWDILVEELDNNTETLFSN